MSDKSAFKINTHGYSGDHEKVSLWATNYDNTVTMRFPGLPSEIKYAAPDSMKHDMFQSKEFDAEIEKISSLYGKEVAFKAASKIVHQFNAEARYGVFSLPEIEQLDKQLSNEAAEIIDHFINLMKAQLVDYVAARHDFITTRLAELKKETSEKLKEVIAKGESAIPADQENK